MIGRAYGVHWSGERLTRFWWENTNERDQWENLGMDGRKILK